MYSTCNHLATCTDHLVQPYILVNIQQNTLLQLKSTLIRVSRVDQKLYHSFTQSVWVFLVKFVAQLSSSLQNIISVLLSSLFLGLTSPFDKILEMVVSLSGIQYFSNFQYYFLSGYGYNSRIRSLLLLFECRSSIGLEI